VWLAAFVPSIFAVHAVKAALKKRPEERWILRAAPVAALLTLALVAAGALLLRRGLTCWPPCPPVAVALGVAARPPHPRQLKRVGVGHGLGGRRGPPHPPLAL
jgi:hypothetical protein